MLINGRHGRRRLLFLGLFGVISAALFAAAGLYLPQLLALLNAEWQTTLAGVSSLLRDTLYVSGAISAFLGLFFLILFTITRRERS